MHNDEFQETYLSRFRGDAYQRTTMPRYVGRCGKFGVFCPEGRRFESHYSRQVLHSQLPVALRRVNSDTVAMLQSGAPLSSSGLEKYPE